MVNKILLQKITIFSDGAFFFSTGLGNKNEKSVRCLNKDLKKLQESVIKKSINSSTKDSSVSTYRQKLFK
jgi:hypothetical protein